MSEGIDGADAQGSDAWQPGLSADYIFSRYRLRSGARQKTRDLLSYTAYRVDMAYPGWGEEARFRRLPPPIRALLTIRTAVGLTNNGDVAFLLSYGLPAGHRFGEIVRDFRLAGATDVAERLEEVYRLFPGGVPQRCDRERKLTLSRLAAEHWDVVDRASLAFQKSKNAAYRVAATRIRLAPYLLRPMKIWALPPIIDRFVHYQPI
jgi:hypothetical protein